mgnify:CR=1 FL=1
MTIQIFNIFGKRFHNFNNIRDVSLTFFYFTNEIPIHFITNQIIVRTICVLKCGTVGLLKSSE